MHHERTDTRAQKPSAAPLDRLIDAGTAVGITILITVGFLSSYDTLATLAAGPGQFPEWLAPAVPLSFDVGIITLTLKVYRLAREGRGAPLLRLMIAALSISTVAANASAASTWTGRILHAVPPAMFVITFESAIASARRHSLQRMGLLPAPLPRIRGLRWLLAPLSTSGAWRRLVLEDLQRPVLAAREDSTAAVEGLAGATQAHAEQLRVPAQLEGAAVESDEVTEPVPGLLGAHPTPIADNSARRPVSAGRGASRRPSVPASARRVVLPDAGRAGARVQDTTISETPGAPEALFEAATAPPAADGVETDSVRQAAAVDAGVVDPATSEMTADAPSPVAATALRAPILAAKTSRVVTTAQVQSGDRGEADARAQAALELLREEPGMSAPALAAKLRARGFELSERTAQRVKARAEEQLTEPAGAVR